jgi:hypothetical protein
MAQGTRCLIGDMGYDADRIRRDLLVRGVLTVIPSNPARPGPARPGAGRCRSIASCTG